ncbi:MAG TPA: hypothetical protein PLJ21_00245, partial [Pseudobdellovibrionaceae bacterium]|nr:hypothetical protein [Pseudobdellovibrionaceae bacterium]
MKKSIFVFLILIGNLYLLTCNDKSNGSGGSGGSSRGRGPASQDNIEFSATEDQIAKYNISKFPTDKQNKFSIERTELYLFVNKCRSGEFAEWMSPATTAKQQAEKESILSLKLNRPFYFQLVQNQDQKIHFVGSMNDFNEYFCISQALSDGQPDSTSPKFSSNFYETASRLPNINFQVLSLLLGKWLTTNLDLNSGISIVQSDAFDYLHAVTILRSIFKLRIKTDERVKLVQAILGTKAFADHSFELSETIVRESDIFILPEERIKITEALLNCGRSVDKKTILTDFWNEVPQGLDFTSIFQSLTNGTSADFTFKAFSSILKSGGKIQNPERIFLTIWSKISTAATMESMITFALKDWEKELWLSRPT